MEQKVNDILLTHVISLFRSNHATLNGCFLNVLHINSVTIIPDLNDNVISILISIKENRTNLRLSTFCTNLSRFQTMIGGITKQVHQRITDFIYHGTIQLRFLTGHIQFHLLIQLLGQIPDHSWELAYNTLNRNHSYLHNRFVKIRGYTLKIFNLLVKGGTVHTFYTGCRYKGVLCNDQLAHQIH